MKVWMAAVAVAWSACGPAAVTPSDGGSDGGEVYQPPDSGVPDAGVKRKRAFVTSKSWKGNLKGTAASGVLGADAKCQSAAAKLGGTWKAYVSTETESAVDRIQDVGPWEEKRADGSWAVVIADKATLSNVQANVTVGVDETWAPLTGAKTIWTGNLPNGARESGATCKSWESDQQGDSGEVGTAEGNSWQHGGADACSNSHRLLCLEQ
jgi:hypothetical protein